MYMFNNFKFKVPDTIFRRGLYYYQNNHIRGYNINSRGDNSYLLQATVLGARYYQLEIALEFRDEQCYFECSCNCPYEWGDICKHIVAVLIKFRNQDYQRLYQQYLLNNNYQRLMEFSGIKNEEIPDQLDYTIKGFLSDLVNFKLYINSDSLSDELINKIINYLTDSYLSWRASERLSEFFSEREFALLKELKELDKSKGREKNTLLLNKNQANLNFLLELMRNYPVFLEETKQQVQPGNVIDPGVIISGDLNEISLQTAELDSKIFYDRSYQVDWVVNDNIISPVNLSALKNIPDKITIPEGKEGELLFEIIPALKERLEVVDIAENLKIYRLIKIEPKVVLQFDYKDNNIICQAEVEVDGESYQNAEILEIEPHDPNYVRDKESPEIWYGRDNQALHELLKFLIEYDFMVRTDAFILKNNNCIQEFITDGFIHIPEDWEVTTSENFAGIEINTVELEPVITMKEGGGINWFEFSVTYNLGGKSYTRAELQKMISYNSKGEAYVVIDNSYFILQQGDKETRVQEILKQTDPKQDASLDGYRSKFFNLLLFREVIKETGINFQGNKVYNQLDQEISQQNPIEEVEIPPEVSNKLRNYQKRGFYWLRFLNKYHFGGILADDMGLGKTVQVLTLLKSIDSNELALIVCPRTLIYNWAAEIEKFFPQLSYLVYYGTPDNRKEMRASFSDYQLIITSYSVLSRDYQEFSQEGREFSYCILDEAQHIKNYKTQRARAVKKIKAARRLALTGTPLENSVDELWSIFDFLMKGYLGNHNYFSKNYLNPIMKENNLEKMEELKKRVAPFILRRRKEEVLTELPEKIINLQPVEMTRLQEDTYRLVLEQVRGELIETIREKGFNRSQINVLTALTRLRQICNHPALILGKEGLKQNSGKLEALREIVTEAVDGGHKLLIFSQFVKMLKLIRNELKELGISYEYLDGSTVDRMDRVKKFNENQDIKVFLISLKAGGTGLNLTSADMVIHVDPWWNPMVEKQATDRAHRLGQDKRVVVYRLITRGTVEEKMLKLQEKKQNIFDSVVESQTGLLQSITWEDIQELLEIH